MTIYALLFELLVTMSINLVELLPPLAICLSGHCRRDSAFWIPSQTPFWKCDPLSFESGKIPYLLIWNHHSVFTSPVFSLGLAVILLRSLVFCLRLRSEYSLGLPNIEVPDEVRIDCQSLEFVSNPHSFHFMAC